MNNERKHNCLASEEEGCRRPDSCTRPGSGERIDVDLVQRSVETLTRLWQQPDPPQMTAHVGPHSSSEEPPRFGRFVIREELGRGGHGVVFRARDPLLQRDVAVKIPRPEALGSEEIQSRFLVEAHALAALDHPGLVPIYEAGHVGPVLYLATQLCTGPTLAEWRRRQSAPVPPRVAAAIVAKLARVVQYLHEQDVLHRDLKPENVLLDLQRGVRPPPEVADDPIQLLSQFDLKLTDFGLARLPGSERLTPRGTTMGTPPYMAPEQTRGAPERIGPWSDIYSLGVILYELVTGHLPCEEHTTRKFRPSPTPGPVTAPNPWRGEVPRELKRVCLTCLQRQPADRYRSAQDLAADLDRYLRGEAVHPPGSRWSSRLVRQCRRHPWATMLGLMAAILLLTSGWVAGRRALAPVPAALDGRESYLGVNQIYDAIGEDPQWDSLEMQPLRRQLVEAALKEYRSVREHSGPSLAVDEKIAHLTYRAAGIHAVEQNYANAAALYEESQGGWQWLLNARPDCGEYQLYHAKCLREHALCLTPLGRRDEATRELEEAVRLLRELEPKHPGEKVRFELATAEYELAARRIAADELAEAQQLVELSRRRLEELVARDPQNVTGRRLLASTWTLMGRVALGRPSHDEAAQSLQTAQAQLQILSDEQLDLPWSTRDLVKVECQLARLSRERGQLDEARSRLDEILERFQAHPPVQAVDRLLSAEVVGELLKLAGALQKQQRQEDALRAFAQCVTLLDAGAPGDRDRLPLASPDIVRRAIRAHLGVAQCELALGKAETSLSACRETQRILADVHDGQFDDYLATSWELTGCCWSELSAVEQALDAFRRAEELRAGLYQSRHDDPALRSALVRVCRLAAEACVSADWHQDAAAWTERGAAWEEWLASTHNFGAGG